MGEWRAVGGGHSATHQEDKGGKKRKGLLPSGHMRATSDAN